MHTCTYVNRSGSVCGNEEVVHRSSFAGTMFEFSCANHYFEASKGDK